ncbi:hypothetical protein SEVIR_8G189800v4 [Setaria viridis]|nr:uncharacterized protein LOC117834740 [Setaria viridis]
MAGRFLLRRLFSRLSSVPTSLLGPRASPSSTPAATRRTAEGEARTLLGDLAHGRRAPAHPPRCREIHGSVSISSTQLLLKNSQSLSVNHHEMVIIFSNSCKALPTTLLHQLACRRLRILSSSEDRALEPFSSSSGKISRRAGAAAAREAERTPPNKSELEAQLATWEAERAAEGAAREAAWAAEIEALDASRKATIAKTPLAPSCFCIIFGSSGMNN